MDALPLTDLGLLIATAALVAWVAASIAVALFDSQDAMHQAEQDDEQTGRSP